MLLDAIFAAPDADNIGLIVDGYPRTSFQADLLKLLYDRMMEVHEVRRRDVNVCYDDEFLGRPDEAAVQSHLTHPLPHYH